MKIGDLVKLKGGGPVMVVDEKSSQKKGESIRYTCTWYCYEEHMFKEHTFNKKIIAVYVSK